MWLILSLIPCINIIAMWMLANDTAELFGKELGWKIFLFLIPGISHIVPASAAPRSTAAPWPPASGSTPPEPRRPVLIGAGSRRRARNLTVPGPSLCTPPGLGNPEPAD